MQTPPEVVTADAAEDTPKQFTFTGFAVRKAIFEEITRTPLEENEARPDRLLTNLQITTNIQISAEERRAQVTLDVRVFPDLKWQPYRIEVSVSGLFGGLNVTEEQFDHFCKVSVPPILFPYVREIVHRLTMDGAFGIIRLHPVNVSNLVARSLTKLTE